MKNIVPFLVLLAAAPFAYADQVDDVRDGRDLDFDLKGMNYAYTGAQSGSGTVADADAPPTCIAKDPGTLSFVLDTAALGLPFSVMLPMTGTKISSTSIRWVTDTDVNRCVTVTINGTPTQILIRRVQARFTTTTTDVPTFQDPTCGHSYNVRMDDTGGNPENFITADCYALCFQSTFTRISFNASEIDVVQFGGLGRIRPASINLLRGIVIAGGLSSVQESEDNYLVSRPGIVFSNSEAPIQVVATGISTTSSPAQLKLMVEAKANQSNINQKIDLYNYTTSTYDTLDSRAATTTDSAVALVVASGASNYVDPATNEMKTRISYKASGPVFSYPWLASIDQIQWLVP